MEETINIPCSSKEHKNVLILRMWRPFINNPTETEIKVLALLLVPGTDTITKELRHTVRTKLDTDKFTFNNYVQKLKDKNLLYVDKEGKVKIHNNIINLVCKDEFKVKFNESAG